MIRKIIYIVIVFFFIFVSSAIASDVLEININFDQKYFIEMSGVYRYSVVDPEMLELKEIENGKLEITPLKKGITYLHVWSDKGRTTYKIIVKRDIKKEYEWEQDEDKIKNNLKLTYTTKWGNGQGYSPYATNQFLYKWFLHQIKMTGKTPIGDMTSFIQVESRDNSTDLVYANAFFNKDNKYLFSIGDTYANLSNLTMNNLDFQGGLFQGELFKKLRFTLLGGNTGKRYWGGKVWTFPNDKTNFVGGYLDFYVNSSLSLYAFGARGFNKTYSAGAVPSGNYAINNFGGGMQLKLWDPLKLKYEYAYDQTSKTHAHEATLDYYNKLANFSYTFRSVPLNFGSVSNMVSYAGQEGYSMHGAVRILPYLTLDGSLRRYRYYRLQDSTQPSNQKYTDNRIGLRFKKIGYPDIYFGRSRQERSFYDGDAFHNRTTFSISHLFHKNNNLRTYFRYEPSSYTKQSLPTQNYTNKRALIGGEVKIFNKLRFIVEEEIQKKNYYNIGQASTIMGINLEAYLDETRIPKTPLYFSSNFKYEHDSDLALTVPESISFWQEYILSCRFRKPNKGIEEGKVYFKYIRRGLSGRTSLAIDRDVASYEYGAEVKLDSKIYLVTPKAYVKGFVYYDKNGNGYKDDDERYIPQIYVKTSQGSETLSNSQGLFTMILKPGEHAVFIDTSQIPKGFMPSFYNPDRFNIKDGEHKQLDLALISDTGVKGIVYLDSNKNGYHDEGEEVIPDVTLLIDNQKIKVNQNGEFFLSTLEPGYYQISYYDINEIKDKYKTKKYQYQVKVNRGKYSNIAIPLMLK